MICQTQEQIDSVFVDATMESMDPAVSFTLNFEGTVQLCPPRAGSPATATIEWEAMDDPSRYACVN